MLRSARTAGKLNPPVTIGYGAAGTISIEFCRYSRCASRQGEATVNVLGLGEVFMIAFAVIITCIFVAAGGAVTLVFRNMQRRKEGGHQS
jgi:hypothetical protein